MLCLVGMKMERKKGEERMEDGKGEGESSFPMGPLFCFLPNWEKMEGRGEKK